MPSESFLGRYATSTALLVGILLFLLPFTEIRCNDKPFASNTGLGLALGKDYSVNDDVNSLSNRFNDSSAHVSSDNENGKLYAAALAALLLAVAGFVSSLLMERSTVTSIITSFLAACALIILMVQIKHDVNEKSIDPGQIQIGGFSRSVKIVAVFTIWYYLSLLSFLLAAFLSYQRWRSKYEDAKEESATLEQTT